MFKKLEIMEVKGREILDSRGNPTVEAEMTVRDIESGKFYSGRGSVPSGASTGKFEAVELRDQNKRYQGMGVKEAVKKINDEIAPILVTQNAMNQRLIDQLLIRLDGTDNKSNLGANAILAVSIACARAASNALNIPLYRYLGGANTNLLPVPMMNILNGGKHAANTVDFQEFMILPVKVENFAEGLKVCSEIYHKLKKILMQKGLATGVGDEGGFAPDLPDARAVLTLIVEAIKECNYIPGEEIQIALDVASSELYNEKTKKYYFPGESKIKGIEVIRDTSEMIAYYKELIKEFPIVSIEDGLAEDDWEGWKMLTDQLRSKIQLVGDDLFVTNVKRLDKGIKSQVANAILVKINQIGTISEAFDTVEMAQKNGYKSIISHRSGETEDTIISDIAVALNAGQIKTGAPCRSDRVAKYNQLLRIEEELSVTAKYKNPFL